MRRSTGLPTLIVMCKACKAAGRKRKLAEFDLGPDGPSQTHHTVGQWNDAETMVHLRCAYGHDPQMTRLEVTGRLGAVTGEETIYL